MELFNVYPLFDIHIVRGNGSYVWDDRGQQYLDLYGGHAVISIGHTHPHYTQLLSEQLCRLSFYSNSVVNNLQQELADRLGKACGYEDYTLFLVNSGAEANENAMKLASFHTGHRRVLSCKKSFHGRTSLAVEATDNPDIVAPINNNALVCHLPINELNLWAQELAKGDVACCILEPIQGVGGIHLIEQTFLQGLRMLCDKYGSVLILDEIQCGYGRSGKFFAHQYLDVRPDIVTVAKGIANGFPMGALLIGKQFKPTYGMLGTTFGGNHLGCAAALAVLDVMEKERLVENAAFVGQYLIGALNDACLPHIIDVRGRGLIIGIELDIPYNKVREKLLYEKHIFTGCSGTNILRLLPPLCLNIEQANEFLMALEEVLNNC